ncbi:MAG: response regulator [Spirulinaceae cyanobacterium RM2_2_10]|nr:response regulator [Spirulinaceae cyanobacterium RM2_2_10]
MHPDDTAIWQTAWAQMYEQGQPAEADLRLVRSDGRIRHVYVQGEPLVAPSGELTGLFGTLADITERKHTEAQLRDSQTQLSRQLVRMALLQRVSDEIRRSLDSRQIFHTAAQQIGQAFRVDRCLIHVYQPEPTNRVPIVAEYLSTDTASLLTIEVPIAGNRHMQRLLTQERAIASPDVYTDPLLAAAAPFCRDIGLQSMLAVGTFYQGQPNGVIGLHQCDRPRHWTADEIELIEALAGQLGIALAQADLLAQEVQRRQELAESNQALQAAKEAAEAASRAKGEFLANMSHEIRTPMNAVLGFADLLHPLVVEPQAKSYLEAIAASGKVLLTLIDDILDLSKIEAGRLKLHYEPIDLRATINEIWQIFQQKALAKQLAFYAEVDASVPAGLYFDDVRWRQILLNLVGNALKFTERGTVRVTVRAYPSPNSADAVALELRVTDTGIGIAPEDHEQLFQAFRQSDGQSTRRYGGTGLGLAIVQHLTQMIGGHIELSSQVGIGTRFTLSFPEVAIAPEPPLAPAIAPTAGDLDQFQPAKLLVVDDVASNRELIAGYFANTAHQLLFASDGTTGVELARTQQPDLILLDLRMPGLDGRGAALILKHEPVTRTIPILLLTAQSPQDDEAELQQLCQGFVRKPVSRQQLVAALRSLLPLRAEPDPDTRVQPATAAAPLPPGESVDLLTLRVALEQALATTWPPLRDTLSVRQLSEFLTQLEAWEEVHHWPPLNEYRATLRQAFDTFDWLTIPVTVNRFPELLQRLRLDLSA